MGYTGAAIKGFSWLTAFRVITRIASIGKTAVMARFLSPTQFGLFGVASLLLSFVEVITETGVNVFLIHQKDIKDYLPTAWLVSIIRGIIIAVVMVLSAPLVAGFFKAPESIPLLYVMSLVPFLRGFINPAVVKFQKDLLFKEEFYFRTIILFLEIMATIIFLYSNADPISLIWGLIVGVLVEVILSYVMISERPHFAFSKSYIIELLHHSKWITSAVIFNYGFERGDNIIVGRMLNTQALGIYDMAYRFSMLPITEVANMLVRVVFPVFVKISDDYERLRKAYLKTIFAVTSIVTPFGIIVFLFPTQIISILLGDQWLAAAEVLKILAVLGVVRAISQAISSLLLALNKVKYITLTTFIGLFGMLATIVPLILMFGIVGAAYAACIGYLFSVPFIVYYAFSSLEAIKKNKAL